MGETASPAAIAAVNLRRLQQGLEFGDQLLQLTGQDGDPVLLVEGHYSLGVTLSWQGFFTQSRLHLEQALAHYDPARSPTHIARYSQDPGVICRCRLAFDLLCLGYPDQAKAAQDRGVAEAQELAHPFSLAYALTWDAMLRGEMGDVDLQTQSAEAAIALSVGVAPKAEPEGHPDQTARYRVAPAPNRGRRQAA